MISATLDKVSELRKKQLEKDPGKKIEGKQDVIFYASGFLQKPGRAETSISRRDINGFMNALNRVGGKSLTLILHTSGGSAGAVESIVGYLHSKYEYMEVIIPAYAMSGGAMISLASDRIIMNRASQIGPIDAQMPVAGGHFYSAQVIRAAFIMAKDEILRNKDAGHFWHPLLRSVGDLDSFEAHRTLYHSWTLVNNWLSDERRLLLTDKKDAGEIAAYFNAEENSKYGQIHVHHQRIDLEKLREMNLNVDALEEYKDLSDAVMTAYWVMTLIFEQTYLDKFIVSNTCDDLNQSWWIEPKAHPSGK